MIGGESIGFSQHEPAPVSLPAPTLALGAHKGLCSGEGGEERRGGGVGGRVGWSKREGRGLMV